MSCDPQPGCVGRERAREVDHHATRGDLDPGGELEQPQPKRSDLGVGAVRMLATKPEFLHQRVGGRGQQDTKLVGQEARAAGSIDGEIVLQLLDPILRITPVGVNLIDMLGR